MSGEPPIDALGSTAAQIEGCTRCSELVACRTQAVAGSGPAAARVVFVVEAPGPHEDELGVLLVGRAGRLFDRVLDEIGLRRGEVLVTAAVKCRTPDNRPPTPGELAACRGFLDRQVSIVEPEVVCPLGAWATRFLRGDPAPITRVRGQVELREIGGVHVHLLPLLHPAAALYGPDGIAALRHDMGRIPALLALGRPEVLPVGEEAGSERDVEGKPALAGQLGLF